MICDACTADNCEVCTGVVYAERKTEKPCTCPDAMHDSPRKFRRLPEDVPPVSKLVVINGVPLVDPEEPCEESAYFWREVARDLKLRLDRAKASNEGNRNSKKKLQRRLAQDD